MNEDHKPDVLNGISRATWNRLYELADRIKALAPWLWLGEEELFGVQEAGAKNVWLGSFMGGPEQPSYACIFCRGWEARHDLRALRAHGPAENAAALLEIPHLQVVFTGRALVSHNEKLLLRALGRRCRGSHDWTVFRAFQPGYLPWLPTPADAQALVTILHQMLGVALRVESGPELLQSHPDQILVRVPPAASGGAWADVWCPVPDEAEEIAIRVRSAGLTALQQAPLTDAVMEVDLTLTPSCLQPVVGERPQLLYVLALVDAATGRAEHVELMQALEGMRAMWQQVPERLVEVWSQQGSCPREVHVRSERMMNLLRPLTEKIPFRLVRCAELPRLDTFLAGMARYLKTNRMA